MFGKAKAWLDGKKTHISAVATAIAVVWLYKHNMATEKDVTEAVGAALMFMFLRRAGQKAIADHRETVDAAVRDLRDVIANGTSGGQPAVSPSQPAQPPALPPAVQSVPVQPPQTPIVGKQWP